METVDESVETTAWDSSAADYQGTERRRPGRPQHISPHLIALLRDDEQRSAAPVMVEAHRAIVGIGVAILLSVPLWLMLGVIAWALLG